MLTDLVLVLPQKRKDYAFRCQFIEEAKNYTGLPSLATA